MKTNWLRSSSAACAALLLAGSLAGCGGDKTSSAPADPQSGQTQNVKYDMNDTSIIKDLGGREIKWYIWGYQLNDQISEAEKARDERIANIEKRFHCKINVLGSSDIDLNSIYQSIMAGSSYADIIDGGGPHTISAPLKSGVFLPLDSLNVLDFSEEKWDPVVTQALTFNGKTYGVMPKQEGFEKIMLNQVLYFNKRLVREAGYDPDSLYQLQKDGKWTWDKFEEIGKAILNLKKNNSTLWSMIGNQGNLYNNLVFSNNTDWIERNADSMTFTADNPGAMEALNFYKKLFDGGLFPKDELETDSIQFVGGKVGFICDYVNRIPRTYAKMKDDYGLLMMPKGPQAEDYRSQLNWFNYWSIATTADKPEDLALVLDYFCEPYWTQEEEQEVIQTQMESYVRDEGSMDTLNMIFDKSAFSPINYEQGVSNAWYWTGLPKVKDGSMTPAAAVASLKEEYNAIFKEWYQIP